MEEEEWESSLALLILSNNELGLPCTARRLCIQCQGARMIKVVDLAIHGWRVSWLFGAQFLLLVENK